MTCEDYPCCGHERGDCDGLLYGSDEDIKEAARRAMDEEDLWGPGWGCEDEEAS